MSLLLTSLSHWTKSSAINPRMTHDSSGLVGDGRGRDRAVHLTRRGPAGGLGPSNLPPERRPDRRRGGRLSWRVPSVPARSLLTSTCGYQRFRCASPP